MATKVVKQAPSKVPYLYLGGMIAVVDDREHCKPFEPPRKECIIYNVEEHSSNSSI